jgi:hypothetical protein
MRGRACWAWCWAFGIFFAFHCATTVPSPSPDRPRAACFVSCSDGRPLRSTIQRQCVGGGHLRGQDITVTGEVDDEQNPHQSFYLAGKNADRGTYPKDAVVWGTCTMFFIGRGSVDEHMMGALNSGKADRP